MFQFTGKEGTAIKNKHNAGYSLIEVVVAMAILALIVIPVSTGMVTAFKMNAKAEKLMHAELAVSSAVESLMSTGIDDPSIEYPDVDDVDIDITEEEEGAYYKVTVKSKEVADVTVVTYIRAVDSPETSAEEEGG